MDLRKQRLSQIEELREKGYEPYKYRFSKDYNSQQIKDLFDDRIKAGQLLEEMVFNYAGRIMTIRMHGKSAFVDLKDDFGRIQAYVRLDQVGKIVMNFSKNILILEIGWE